VQYDLLQQAAERFVVTLALQLLASGIVQGATVVAVVPSGLCALAAAATASTFLNSQVLSVLL
jgi:hypothetical protein